MRIDEAKMKIVIDNYFKTLCSVNTSIREAFEKGFRIGVTKGMQVNQIPLRCRGCSFYVEHSNFCSMHNEEVTGDDYCSHGAWVPKEG